MLSGQHPDDLGFDPAMIPSWINTQFHGGIVADLQSMSAPQIELGAIVDGITDIGFRNVLHSAKRDRMIPINLASLNPAQQTEPAIASPTATPPALTHRVEPPASFTVAPTPPTESAPPTFRVEPGNPFSQVPEAPAAEAAPAQATAPTPAPAPAATGFIQPIAAGLDQFTAAIATRSSSPPPAPPAPEPPAPPTPAADTTAFSGFSAVMDPFAPTGESTQLGAGDRSPSAGFSSFDLLGGESTAKPPSLFPDTTETEESSVPPSLFAPEIPEIPTTVEKPAPEQPPVANARSESFSWAAFSQNDDLSGARPVNEPQAAPSKAVPAAFVPVEMPEPSAFFPAPEPVARPEAPPQTPAPMFSTTASPRPAAASKPSMGLSAVSAGAEEQLMLRALLGTDEELTIGRVMELTVGLPGITACALIKGEQVLAGESTKGSDARAFRAQAAEVARSLRTLAPLIGIADAETFTLNTESRLITLCFPGAVTLGILHDREPSLGLRDKLTLIARQLEQMVKAS
jgi:hypothetical protein